MPRTRQIKPDIKYFPKPLMEKLEQLKSYPMTLLEAQSGFGKTTAMHHFFETRKLEAIPLYKHAFDADTPDEAWRHFCELIAAFDQESADALTAVGMPDEDTMSDIKRVMRSLSCPDETYLFLDDFQLWRMPQPCEFLMALSLHQGENLHIVVATHPYSSEQRTALLQNGLMWTMWEDEFAFTREDTDAYYRQAGLSLTGSQLDEVAHLTGGWVIALYLQMEHLIKTGAFEHGGMEALMEKSFWGSLSEAEQKFLLEISIFPRFTLTQATAFSGLTAEETDNRLREKRFFICYDRESRSYAMHTQLKKLLAERFVLLTEERQKEIFLMGGEQAQKAGDRMNTLRFYYQADARERLFALPLTSYDIADAVDETTTPMILDMLVNTPYETKVHYPKALIPLAFTLFFLGENKELLRRVDEIESVIAESVLSEKEKNALRGEMELLLSFLEYNRIDDMSVRHRRALTLLGGSATLINVKSTWTFGSPSVLYMFWREIGKLNAELAQMDECMPFYYQLTRGHGTGAELVMRAEALLYRGETQTAETLCYRAVFTADSKRQSSISQCGVFTLARIAILKGNAPMLEESLHTLADCASRNTEDLCRFTYDLAHGYLSLLLGKTGNLAPWLLEGRIDDKRLVIMAQPFAHILYGRVLLEQEEYQKLLGVGEYVLGISSIFPNLLPQVYIKIYMAGALIALRQTKEAGARLGEALALALPDGLILPFAENYVAIKKLLPESDCPQEVRDTIAALARTLAAGVETLNGGGFTPRERELIAFIQQGVLDNELLSKKMLASVSTVRKLLAKVYLKTETSTKAELVLWLKSKKISDLPI